MTAARIAANRWIAVGRAGLDLYADPPGARVDEARTFTSALGGSAANFAAGIVKLGGSASILTTLSDDAVGRWVCNELGRYGVATDLVRFAGAGPRTSLALVATRNDDTQSVIYRNGASDFELSADQAERVSLEGVGGVVVTGTALALEPSRGSTFLAAARARSAGVAVVFDIDYRPYSWRDDAEAALLCRRFAEASDLVVGNDEEFAVLADGGDGERLARDLARTGKTCIYKMGARGARSFVGETLVETPVFAVEALKPTGAGDAFLAGLLTGLATGSDFTAAARRGAAAAAIVVGRVGCAPAAPTREELEAFLSRRAVSGRL